MRPFWNFQTYFYSNDSKQMTISMATDADTVYEEVNAFQNLW